MSGRKSRLSAALTGIVSRTQRTFHVKPVLANGFHVIVAPYERHIFPSPGKQAADQAAHGASTNHGDFSLRFFSHDQN